MNRSLSNTCTACGARDVSDFVPERSVPFLGFDRRRGTVQVVVSGCRCGACGFEWHTPEQLESVTEPVVVAMGSAAPSTIRMAREQRAWTQHELARAAGMSERRVAQIELRRAIPTLAEDEALRRALDLGDRGSAAATT